MPLRNAWSRFSKNFLAYGYSQIVTLAVQFLAVPFFLRYWGSERYAEWLVLSGIPVMLGLLDFGVAHASASKATMLAGKNDINGIRCSLQTSTAFSVCVSLAILLISASASIAIDWQHLLKLSTLNNTDAQAVLILLTAHLCVQLLGGPLNAWYLAMDRAATGYFLLANRRLLDVLVIVVGLVFELDAIALSLSMLIGQLALLAILVVHAHRQSPWPVIGFKHSTMNELRSVLKPSLAHVGITISQTITLQAGIQFINQIAPSSVVVLYSMIRTLMRLILQIGVVANHAVRPELSRLFGAENSIAAQKLLRRVAVPAVTIAALCYVALIFLGPEIVHLWSAGKIETTHQALAFIGLHALLNAAWLVWYADLFATNRHGSIAIYSVIGCAASLAIWMISSTQIDSIFVAAASLAAPEIAIILGLSLEKYRSTRCQKH